MSQRQRTPYEILGVGVGASEGQIRKKYRKLCKRFHPDLNQGDPQAAENFKEVQSAYEALLRGITPENGDRGTEGMFHGDHSVSDFGKPFSGFFQAVRMYCTRMNPGKDSVK